MTDDLPVSKYDPVLTETHLAEIGRVAARASVLQEVMQALIWPLLGIENEVGRALTAHLAPTNLTNMLRTVGQLRIDDADTKANFDELLARIDAAFESRNAVIHANWAVIEPGDTPRSVRMRTKGGITYQHREISEAWTRQVADEILQVIEDLRAFGLSLSPDHSGTLQE